MDPKEILEKEGFPRVYEWTDPPNETFPKHSHKGKVSFFVIKGAFTMKYPDKEVVVKEGMRHDVPIGVPHLGYTGSEGAVSVVGEEFDEGD